VCAYAKWYNRGSTKILVKDFLGVLPADFQAKYDYKIATEYSIAAANRVYCPCIDPKGDGKTNCNRFLGARAAVVAVCTGCECQVCKECKSIIASGAQHVCGGAANPLEGLRRGEDYQQCSNQACRTVVSQLDGCNAFVCRSCFTHFCYLCGEAAHHDSRHVSFTSRPFVAQWSLTDCSG
jgi:hypothetical protein